MSWAAISTFPSVAAMRGYIGRDNTPRRDHFMSQRYRGRGKDRSRGRGRFVPGRRAVRVNEAGIDDDDEYAADQQDDAFEDDPTFDLDRSLSLGDDDEDDDSELPEEIEAAERDAEVFLTQAKKQRAEVEQAWGFCRKGRANPDPKARAEHFKSSRFAWRARRVVSWDIGMTIPSVQRSQVVNVAVIGTIVAIGP